MSHTSHGPQGTLFIHNGDYSGDISIYRELPEPVSIVVPFEDLRELVLDYLASKRINELENAGGDYLERLLMRGPS